MRAIRKEKQRDELVGAKMTSHEVELLDKIADTYSANRSETIRFLIAQEAQRLGFEIPERMKYEST